MLRGHILILVLVDSIVFRCGGESKFRRRVKYMNISSVLCLYIPLSPELCSKFFSVKVMSEA